VRRPDQAAGWRCWSRSHEQLCHRHQEQHRGTMSRLQHLHHRPGIHHDSKTFTVLVRRPPERKSPRKESQRGDRTWDQAFTDAKTTEDLSLTIDVVVKFYLCLSSSSCISAGRRWALHRITLWSIDLCISRVSHGLIANRVFLCASCCCLLLLCVRRQSSCKADRLLSEAISSGHANLPVPQPEHPAMAVDQPLSRRHWSASSSPFYRSAAPSCRRTWSRAADHVVVARLRPSSPSNAAAVANCHEELTIGH
jgi:hypothetical protein